MADLISFKFLHYEQCEKCKKPILNDFFFCVCESICEFCKEKIKKSNQNENE